MSEGERCEKVEGNNQLYMAVSDRMAPVIARKSQSHITAEHNLRKLIISKIQFFSFCYGASDYSFDSEPIAKIV